jgi:hypothetical protein
MAQNVILMDSVVELIGQIQRRFRPGLLRWVRKSPRHWKRLIQLEERVNYYTVNSNEKMLVRVLEEYRNFFDEIIFFYENGKVLPS